MTRHYLSNFLGLPALLVLALALLPGAPLEAEEGLVLEEIVVTARKRSEDLQDTPISVTALTGTLISDVRLTDIKDIENLTPNLNFLVSADGSGSTLQAFIRGVGQFDFAVTTDPGVGVYVDGVYLARTIGANVEFSDVERVEVLRGPQGTLFGKNTIGGAINVVTRAPTGDTGYAGEVTVGEDGYTAFDGYVEFPLGDDLAASLSVLRKHSDGWQERDRGDNAGNDDLWGLRGHLNWHAEGDWQSHLVVDVVEQNQNVYPRVLSDFDPNQFFPTMYNAFVLGPAGESCCATNIDDIDRSGVLNEKDRDDLETLGISWTNTWLLGGLELKSVTGYRNMESYVYRDSDNQPQDYFAVGTGFDTDQVSQEFLLSSRGGNFDWTLGAYFFNEDANHLTEVTIAGGLYEALSALPPFVTTPDGIPLSFLAVPLDLTLNYDRDQETTSYAGFFSGTLHLSERLRLNVGARYTYEEKTLDTFTIKRASQTPIALPGPSPTPECSAVTPSGNGSRFSCEEDWSEFSPRIGVDYSFSDDLMGYAHISRGFKSGVFNGRPISTQEISVADPEKVTSYEIGFKSQSMGQRLQLNGSVFHNAYEDQQQLVNTSSAATAAGLILLVENAAESSLTGAELELSALLGEGLSVMGGVAWLNAEFDKFDQTNFITGQADDLSHRKYRDAPEWNANLLVQYEHALAGGGTLRIRGDLAYRGDIYYTNDEAATTFDRLHASGFAIFNAGVTYVTRTGDWEVGVYGRNLGDEREVIGGFVVDAFGSTDVPFTEPRRWFVSVKYTGGGGS